VSGTQDLDAGVCLYPTDADETPNQQQLDTQGFPTFTGDTITFYAEDGASQGKQRVYEIVTIWNFDQAIVSTSGLEAGAFNWDNPRTPATGALGDNVWELNNVYVAATALNDVNQQDGADASAVKRFQWRMVCWLIDPTRGGTFKAKYITPPNRIYPPADLLAPAGPYATYKCNVGVNTSLVPLDVSQAIHGGPYQLAASVSTKKKVLEIELEKH
jgi:hypothetical protein